MKTTRNPQIRRRNSGFTLLEMVIVLGIIGMILGGAIFAMRGISQGMKPKQAKADFISIRNALDVYEGNVGRYPTTQQGIAALVERPANLPKGTTWAPLMDHVPLDPWKNPYGYKFPGRKMPGQPEIISMGADGIEGTEDDQSSQN